MTPWWQSLISGAAGGLIALVGVITTLVVQGRRERQRWEQERVDRREERELAKVERLRAQRIDLWRRATGVVMKTLDSLKDLMGEGERYEAHRSREAQVPLLLVDLTALDPDFRLFAPDDIADVWHELIESVEKLCMAYGGLVVNDPDDAGGKRAYVEQCQRAVFNSGTVAMRMIETLRYGMRQIETE